MAIVGSRRSDCHEWWRLFVQEYMVTSALILGGESGEERCAQEIFLHCFLVELIANALYVFSVMLTKEKNIFPRIPDQVTDPAVLNK